MVSSNSLNKIFSALITPMDSMGNINNNAFKQLIQAQINEGVEGFYCCGSSGEGLLLTLEERKQILETTMEVVDGKLPVVSHVGTIRTSDVVELTNHAKSVGAAAVSMIPPYYYKFSMDEIITYYEDVIAAVDDIGVIIYNIPQFTGIEFSKLNAHRLLENKRVVGIKHTSNNLYSMERMKTEYPDKIIMNGFDEQYLGALSMGATATIGTTVNVFADLFVQLRMCFQKGDITAAQQIQKQINYNVETMVSVGIFNAVKYAWTLKGLNCGQCRAPFKPLSKEEKAKIEKLVLNCD